jgi:hypothetical protein
MGFNGNKTKGIHVKSLSGTGKKTQGKRTRRNWKPVLRAPDGMSLEPRHFFRIGLQVRNSNFLQAGRTVGLKDQPKKLRDEVVEFFAIFRIRKFQALGAGGDAFFVRAFLDLAPGIFFAFLAALAFAFEVGATGSAIKAATGN